MSKLYRFDVRVTTSQADSGFEAAVLDRPACLTLLGGAAPRAIHGTVASVRAEGSFLHDRRVYSLRIVPRAWRMKRRITSRIFQDKTTVEIVSQVLLERGLSRRLRITGQYPSRGYCVQYQESDYAFLVRLLAEEGLFFTFDHPPMLGGDDNRTSMGLAEVFVLGDTAKYYPPLDGGEALAFRRILAGGAITPLENQVFYFAAARRLKARAVLLREYDYHRPAIEQRDVAVTAEAAEGLTGPDGLSGPTTLGTAERELFASRTIQEQTVYHHRGDYEDTQVEPKTARIVLEQERARVATAEGASFCRRLAPGRRFTLEGHEVDELDQAYAITRVEHEGYAPEVVPPGRQVYQNRFECVPAGVRFRPRRPKRRIHQVVETAIVTGPEGKEIHTDELGRVKVQFHWDLEGKRDEHTSCWIRVAQVWAGAGFGAQFIPRVGMEVVVTFLGGDVDRPLVTGCVYNGTHPVPFKLPEGAAQSGFRSESTPGGGGANEILFNDTKGGEVVSLRAERNLVETVVKDHRTTVGGASQLIVAGDRITEVSGSLTETLGSVVTTVSGNLSTAVGGRGFVAYAGDRAAQIAGDDTLRVEGGTTIFATKFLHTLIGQGVPEGHGLVFANGHYRVGAAKLLEMSGTEGIKLTCGKCSIELGPDAIKLSGPAVVIEAEKGLSCSGNGNVIALGDGLELRAPEIKLFSKDASLVMDEDAKLDGKLVKLNCDPSRPKPKPADGSQDEMGLITFRLDPKFKQEDGSTLTVVIATPTGETVEKEANPDGEVQLEGRPGDRFVLVDVRKGDQSLTKAAK